MAVDFFGDDESLHEWLKTHCSLEDLAVFKLMPIEIEKITSVGVLDVIEKPRSPEP